MKKFFIFYFDKEWNNYYCASFEAKSYLDLTNQILKHGNIGYIYDIKEESI